VLTTTPPPPAFAAHRPSVTCRARGDLRGAGGKTAEVGQSQRSSGASSSSTPGGPRLRGAHLRWPPLVAGQSRGGRRARERVEGERKARLRPSARDRRHAPRHAHAMTLVSATRSDGVDEQRESARARARSSSRSSSTQRHGQGDDGLRARRDRHLPAQGLPQPVLEDISDPGQGPRGQGHRARGVGNFWAPRAHGRGQDQGAIYTSPQRRAGHARAAASRSPRTRRDGSSSGWRTPARHPRGVATGSSSPSSPAQEGRHGWAWPSSRRSSSTRRRGVVQEQAGHGTTFVRDPG
jgi:hypothetical protein